MNQHKGRSPRWLKERFEGHGVDMSELVRRELPEELEEIEQEDVRKILSELRGFRGRPPSCPEGEFSWEA